MIGSRAAYPNFFVDDEAISTFAKDESVSPHIARQDDPCSDEVAQWNAPTLASKDSHVHLLLLTPKLFKLLFFEGIKIAFLSLLSRSLCLAQPLRVVAAILKVNLELTDTGAPVVGVSNE